VTVPSSQDLWELFLQESDARVAACRALLQPDAASDAWLHLASELELLQSGAAQMGIAELATLVRAAKQRALGRRDADAPCADEVLGRALGLIQDALRQLAEPNASGALLEVAPLQAAIAELDLEGARRKGPEARARAGAAATDITARARAGAAATDITAEIWVPQVDEDMISPFIEECSERIESLGDSLLRLEDAQDPELTREVFRDLHTLKGSSGFVGLQRMNQLAHAAEDLVGQIRDGTRPADRAAIDALLASLDLLREILGRASVRAPIDVPIEAMIQRLRSADLTPAVPQAAATTSPTGTPAPARPTVAARTPEGQLTLRVDFDRLDHLLNLVGELVLSKAAVIRNKDALRQLTDELDARRRNPHAGAQLLTETLGSLEGLWNDLDEATSQLDVVSARLREQVMKLRMVPIAGLFNKYRRVVRDLSHSVGKEVQFELIGAETELDKLLVERLNDPLLHLVRNAVDHGVERPAAREAAGKQARGNVRLQASHRGHQILIEVADDGAGIDPARLGQKAVERGLISEENLERLEPQQRLELIFLPGLSTATEVTNLSGRGVGMDVVKEAIGALKGSIDIVSAPNAGTRFVLKLPLTLAISNVLLCQAGGQVLAVPLHAVKHTLIADPDQTRQVAAYPTLKLDEEIPLIDVARILGLPCAVDPSVRQLSVALVEEMGTTFGLVFDQLLGKQEIVIKSLGALLQRVPCCAGATLLGERCALILDVPALVRRALETPTDLSHGAEERAAAPQAAVLIAEDSDTVREDLHRLLAAAGYAVRDARDGAEALQLCKKHRFDLISTDVMMPGIDGYELSRRLRKLPGYEEIPIVMLTSRDQEIDRIRGFDAGVDAYLTKPVERGEMLRMVARLLGQQEPEPAAGEEEG
jgi:two-component system, chemotaxis family, sensor kinase CheA